MQRPCRFNPRITTITSFSALVSGTSVWCIKMLIAVRMHDGRPTMWTITIIGKGGGGGEEGEGEGGGDLQLLRPHVGRTLAWAVVIHPFPIYPCRIMVS